MDDFEKIMEYVKKGNTPEKIAGITANQLWERSFCRVVRYHLKSIGRNSLGSANETTQNSGEKTTSFNANNDKK